VQTMPSNHHLSVSLIIPSYRRPMLLLRTLREFVNQLCHADEIIVIIHSNDPFRDNYPKLIEEISSKCKVRLLCNPSNNLCHSYNLGIKTASNEILLFSDDDCIPDGRLIENHSSVYEYCGENVIGVTGRITPALLDENRVVSLEDPPLLYPYRSWKRPIKGMDGWFFFITQGGGLSMRGKPDYWLKSGKRLLPSLPLGGGNMSFRCEYLRNIFVDESQKRAFRFEQQLFLDVWKLISEKGDAGSHKFVLNMDANTFHIQNVERTTSRPRKIRDSIELAIESVKSRFRFKTLSPESILLKALLFELVMQMANSLFCSVKVNSQRDSPNWQTSSRYMGEFIGSIIGFVVGIAYYSSWFFSKSFRNSYLERNSASEMGIE
jgi:glycosyltransferase involved in cell wall biosynthesis